MSAGNFSFVQKASNREYLEDAYKAMESTRGSWKILKEMSDATFRDFTGPEGYTPMNTVLDKLALYNDYSGSLMFWVFHKMRAIAVNGWGGFVEEYSGKI
jgi:hypothetical protein